MTLTAKDKKLLSQFRMQKAKDFLDDALDSYTSAVSIIQSNENVEKDILL
jgi:hypothetical protein